MGRKHRNLIDNILSDENFRLAHQKASAGKRQSAGYLSFKEHDAANLADLISSIKNKSYQPGAPREFWVYEPKPRPITALPFRDRIVQHALVNVIMPIFESGMLPNSYACRKGKGSHKGAIATQAAMRKLDKSERPVFALKTDFSKYFYSIDRSVLWRQIRKKISCRHTLWLIEQFTPCSGDGLPIGNLTSQLWANVYGTLVDRFLAQHLKVKNFFRYMDDIVVLHNSRAYLEIVREMLEWFCQYSLRLFFSKWSIQPIDRGVNFLGYRIWTTHKLLRRDSVKKAKRKIRRYKESGDRVALEQFSSSFLGHAKWADSSNLINYLKKEGLCLQN
ncbi:MAG: Retron-type reverse transcriptase [Thiomicrospira sp.]|nr:MAG: Retron-type reverse transcriptase [Thiomicrospira sp.]